MHTAEAQQAEQDYIDSLLGDSLADDSPDAVSATLSGKAHTDDAADAMNAAAVAGAPAQTGSPAHAPDQASDHVPQHNEAADAVSDVASESVTGAVQQTMTADSATADISEHEAAPAGQNKALDQHADTGEAAGNSADESDRGNQTGNEPDSEPDSEAGQHEALDLQNLYQLIVVAGLKLAVPGAGISRVQPGAAASINGDRLVTTEGELRIVDIARFIDGAVPTQPVEHYLLLADYGYAIACGELLQMEEIDPAALCRRSAQSRRRWLAATCARLGVAVLDLDGIQHCLSDIDNTSTQESA